jgi:lysophospholipase L1-like esterase
LSDKEIDPDTLKQVTVKGSACIVLEPKEEAVSDEVAFDITAGETISVSLFMEGYNQMNAGVLITGPLSKGFYSYGNFMNDRELPMDLTRKTNWFYFLNTVDILTEEKNHALICYGDSITAQSWPDYLTIRAWEEGYRNVSIIRRAVSGTRILRQYDNITYAAYGLKGETRFPVEMNTAGADAVLIQHGINDIIHPVGTDVNPFRPWSDLPTAEEMEEGFTRIYIDYARKLGMKVWGGTLIPIFGWRTYEPFREDLKNAFNDWLRTTDLLDGCVDFDLAIRDPEHTPAFAQGYDSGDHLHPSEEGYKAMAYAVDSELLK